MRTLGVVSTFGAEIGDSFLIDYVQVLAPAAEQLDVISPSTSTLELPGVRFHTQKYSRRGHGIMRAIRELSWQLLVSYRLLLLARNTGSWIFFGGEGLILPMLAAKTLRKRTALALAGDMDREVELKGGFLREGYRFFKRINCRLADWILVYSGLLIEGWNLQRYRDKICVAQRHFVDINTMSVQDPLPQRPNSVGYFGRLSEEKGLLRLLEAIPILAMGTGVTAFLIGGDGPLRPKVEQCAAQSDSRIEYVGWIARNELAGRLNQLKLLVLPSYTEGLPNIMLEAMACGTPVLATPVGAIPDVIEDGETGFIMDNNSPHCIAESILRALSHPDLERIAQNARALVEGEFTFERAVAKYQDVLDAVLV